MQSSKKVVGTVAALAALGATSVGIAQTAGSGVEFEAASAELSYQERSRTDRTCRNSTDGDFVRFSRFEGTSTSEDRELAGELDLFTATLVEGSADDRDGAITVGLAEIRNRGENASTSRDDTLTRFGLAAVDQNTGEDEEEDRPVVEEAQPLLPVTGEETRREQDDSQDRDFRVEGFGLGRASGQSNRVLLSNLNVDVAAEEPRGTTLDGDEEETRTGEIDTGNDAGNDGLLASGTCDLDGDGDDDFNEGSGFSGSAPGSRDD